MAKTMLAISLLVGAGACSPPAPTSHPRGLVGPPSTEPVPLAEEPTTTTAEVTTTTEPEPTTTTEPPAPVTTRARSAPTTTVYEPPSPQSRTVGGDAPLACIRSFEQGAAGYATDTGNGFYGAYQFDLATWQSVGGSGNPAHASAAEQDMRAEMLYDRRGLQPWPTPAVMC